MRVIQGCLVDESWGVSLGPQPPAAQAAAQRSGAGVEVGQDRGNAQRHARVSNGKGAASDRRGGRRKQNDGRNMAR